MSMKISLNENIVHGTNLLDVVVPKALEREVKTGCDIWDAIHGGAMTPSCSSLFTGMPGAGKTTLMLQMADAITYSGHICLYNSCEEAVVQIAKTCRRLRIRNGFIIGNDRKVPDILKHANALQKDAMGVCAKDGQPQQVFLIADSLQTLDCGSYSNGHTNAQTPVRIVEQLTTWCKTSFDDDGEVFGIAIVIGHVTKAGEFAGKMTIKHAVDSHMHLRLDEDPKSESFGMRLLESRKNRFGKAHEGIFMNMTGHGLVENTVWAR